MTEIEHFRADNASSFIEAVSPHMVETRGGSFHKLTEDEINGVYRTSWIFRKICDQFATDMTSQGVEWLCESELADLLESRFSELDLWGALTRAVSLSRLYGGALAVLDWGLGRYDQPANFAAPGFAGLRVFSRYEISPAGVLLQAGKHAGEPAFYDVRPVLAPAGFRADASRCLRFIGNRLPARQAQAEQFWGDSVLQCLGNALMRYENACTSTDELMKRCYLRFLGIRGYWDAMADENPEAASNIAKGIDMVNRLQNISGLTVADSTDVFASQQYGFGGITSVIAEFSQQIAGAAEMPLTVIFGMSPAGFSTGESDLKSYARTILAKQETTLRPAIATLAKAILGSEGKSATGVDFRFNPLFQPTLTERAAAVQSAVTAVLALEEKGLLTQERALSEIKRLSESTGFFSSVTDTDIERLKVEEPPAAPGADDVGI